jgi:hypothetical protein
MTMFRHIFLAASMKVLGALLCLLGITELIQKDQHSRANTAVMKVSLVGNLCLTMLIAIEHHRFVFWLEPTFIALVCGCLHLVWWYTENTISASERDLANLKKQAYALDT